MIKLMDVNSFFLLGFFIFGIINLWPKTRNWLIDFENKLRGTTTHITQTTIVMHTMTGVLCILYVSFVLFSNPIRGLLGI